MRLFAVLALLAWAIPALAQHPRLESGPASLLSAPPVYVPAQGAQRMGTIVATPEGWVAVWADDIMQGLVTTSRRLLATRLRPDGSVRDTVGIRITPDTNPSSFTAIADPEGVRVFWIIPGAGRFSLHTATVSDDGEVSDAVVAGDYPGDAFGAVLAAAASGSRTAVVLNRYVMILDGTRLVRIVDLGGHGDPSMIVATGTRFVVTWVASGDILMRQTLDLDGNAIGPAGGTGVAFPARLHSLATDGERALLTWGDVNGIRISVVDPATGELVEKGVIASSWAWPQATWTGSSYLVAWAEGESGAVVGVHVSADGTILDAEPQRLHESTPVYIKVAARGGDTMMLYELGSCVRFFCETDVYAAPLVAGATATANVISAAAGTQTEQAVASDGEGFLALWREGSELFVTETSARSRTPSAPSRLAEVYGYGSRVASTGSGYLAAWMVLRENKYFIEGTPVSGDGTVPSFSIDAGNEGPLLASLGASPDLYLVTWRDGSTHNAARVRPNGELVDSVPIALYSEELPWTSSPIAFDGEDFVVAWYASSGGTEPRYRVLTQRVSPAGIARFDRVWASAPLSSIQGVALGCSSEGTCLIAWVERVSEDGPQWQIVGQRFRKGGALVDDTPVRIDLADRTQSGPHVAWDGSRFVVTWSKYPSDVGPERMGARVVPASGPVDYVFPDLLLEHDLGLVAPSTACNNRGVCIVVSPHFVDDSVFGRTTRLFKRFFGEVRRRAVRR